MLFYRLSFNHYTVKLVECQWLQYPCAPAPQKGRPDKVLAIYSRLLETLHTLGPVKEEPEKTSIHQVHHSGFAGVHPRKSYLYLNLRTDYPIDSPRITKTEQVSKNRFHNELKLSYPDEIDEELLGWLKDAYALG